MTITLPVEHANGSWWALALQHHLLADVVSNIAGFDDLHAASESLAAFTLPDSVSADAAHERAVNAVLSGKDRDTVITTYLTELQGNERRTQGDTLRRGAEREFAGRAQSWATANEGAIAAGLAQIMRERFTQAQKIVGSGLEDIRSGDDLASDPDAGEAWGRWVKIAAQFTELYRLAEAIVRPPRDVETLWPDLWLIEDYEQAWPTFYRAQELPVWDGAGAFIDTFPAVPCPWRGSRPDQILRHLIDMDAEITVRSHHDMSTEQTAMQLRSEKARAAEATRAAKDAGSIITQYVRAFDSNGAPV